MISCGKNQNICKARPRPWSCPDLSLRALQVAVIYCDVTIDHGIARQRGLTQVSLAVRAIKRSAGRARCVLLALVVKLIMSVYISLASGYSIGMNSIHSTKSIDIICVIFATLHRDCSEKYHLASTDTAKSCQVNSDLYCTLQIMPHGGSSQYTYADDTGRCREVFLGHRVHPTERPCHPELLLSTMAPQLGQTQDYLLPIPFGKPTCKEYAEHFPKWRTTQI